MSEQRETAILAGGCFWGMQDLIRKRPGVISTRVGYSGGDVPNATYRNHGTHAEAIERRHTESRGQVGGQCCRAHAGPARTDEFTGPALRHGFPDERDATA